MLSSMRVGIGQDSHRFLTDSLSSKACIMGGVVFDKVPGFDANSDGDVIYHAICNAISSLTGEIILGSVADELCLKQNITDSEVYLQYALKSLQKVPMQILHIALTLECQRPKILPKIETIRAQVASVCQIPVEAVGLTATTGEGLTDFGKGLGVQCFCVLTAQC